MYIVELVIFLMFLLLFFYVLFLCVLRRSTGNSLYLTYLVGLSISYFEYGLLGVPLGFQGSIRTKLYSVLQWLNILAQKLRRFYIILVFSTVWGFLLAYQHKTSCLNTTSPKQNNYNMNKIQTQERLTQKKRNKNVTFLAVHLGFYYVWWGTLGGYETLRFFIPFLLWQRFSLSSYFYSFGGVQYIFLFIERNIAGKRKMEKHRGNLTSPSTKTLAIFLSSFFLSDYRTC